MGPSFALRLARREGRAGLRRIGVFMASITLGVAALVAIHGFRDDVARSLGEQARVLMGADLRLRGNRPLPDSLRVLVDSLVAGGAREATVTGAVSMVLAPRSDRVRLLQVRAAAGGWPFYGDVSTDPAGSWGGSPSGGALADPAVLTQLGVEVGDTLVVGGLRVRIAGVVEDLPTDLGFQTAVGPRVWLRGQDLRDAGLLGVGSLARYETYLQLPSQADADALEARYRDVFRATGFRSTTAREQARDLTGALDHLSRYLGLVGLGALLLGGIGVASAIHVYVTERLSTVAVLRCLGARQGTVFRAYLLQAGALGLTGAAAGTAVGVGVQHVLPMIFADLLPVDVRPRTGLVTPLAGLAVGFWVSVLFALGPLLRVRDVPPLRALRHDLEEDTTRRWADPWRLGTYALLAASVLGLSVLEAPAASDGLAFAAALAGATLLLWLTATALMGATRRLFPASARYPIRQGVSNLFRPRNQTVAVTLALGFGAFVVGAVLQVQASLGAHLTLQEVAGRPNLLLFDVQPDQTAGVLEMLPPSARDSARVTPLVPARVAAIGGRTVAELREDTSGAGPERWALRREYRHTFRLETTPTEEVVAGAWFDAGVPDPEGSARISMEVDLAEDLAVEVGDRITWDVAGRPVESVVTSLRRVDWNRFTTNFFVVFEPGPLDAAPRTDLVLAALPDAGARAAFQRGLVERFPNVSVLDLARVQEVIDGVLARVGQAVRFLAAFSAVAGLLVLAGALATSSHQRTRESALLRTLGARRSQVLTVLLTEYVALGVVAALAGIVLSVPAAAAIVRGMFGIPFRLSAVPLGAVLATVVLLTVGVGLLGSRGILRRPPLPILREAVE